MNLDRASTGLAIFGAALLSGALGLAACSGPVTLPPAATAAGTAAPTGGAYLPNPASVFCELHGYRVEIRTAADGSQSGVCLFPGGAECDEWAYYRGECAPGGTPTAATPGDSAATEAATAPPTLAPAPVVLPTPQGGDAGWLAYEQPEFGFSLRHPPDWVVAPDDNPLSTLYGHALFVQPAGDAAPVRLRIVFRRVGDDLLLWPTGVGNGEFVERDQLAFGDGWLKRVALVCDGRDQAVWYRSAGDGVIRRGDLELSFILARTSACGDGGRLSPEIQAIANGIVTSFTVPK